MVLLCLVALEVHLFLVALELLCLVALEDLCLVVLELLYLVAVEVLCLEFVVLQEQQEVDFHKNTKQM